jgi:hypothetical protein
VDLLAYVFTHPDYLLIDGMPVTDLLEDMQTEAKQVQYLHDLSVSAPGGYLGCGDLEILSSDLNVEIIVVLEAHPPNPASRTKRCVTVYMPISMCPCGDSERAYSHRL